METVSSQSCCTVANSKSQGQHVMRGHARGHPTEQRVIQSDPPCCPAAWRFVCPKHNCWWWWVFKLQQWSVFVSHMLLTVCRIIKVSNNAYEVLLGVKAYRHVHDNVKSSKYASERWFKWRGTVVVVMFVEYWDAMLGEQMPCGWKREGQTSWSKDNSKLNNHSLYPEDHLWPYSALSL